jgi:hypothetical protein
MWGRRERAAERSREKEKAKKKKEKVKRKKEKVKREPPDPSTLPALKKARGSPPSLRMTASQGDWWL